MINVRKTRLLTKCAVYEKGVGAEDIRMSRYFQADYVRLGFLKTVFYTTVGFIVICPLYAIFKLDYLIDNSLELDYKENGLKIGLAYVIVLLGSLMLSWVVYTLKYMISRKRLAKYYKMLRRINIFNEEDMQLKKLEDK